MPRNKPTKAGQAGPTLDPNSQTAETASDKVKRAHLVYLDYNQEEDESED